MKQHAYLLILTLAITGLAALDLRTPVPSETRKPLSLPREDLRLQAKASNHYSIMGIRTGMDVGEARALVAQKFGNDVEIRNEDWSEVNFKDYYSIERLHLGNDGFRVQRVSSPDPVLNVVLKDDGKRIGFVHSSYQNDVSLEKDGLRIAKIGELYPDILRKFNHLIKEKRGDRVVCKTPDGQVLVLYFFKEHLVGFGLLHESDMTRDS